jgi:hypothetical protein
MDAGVLLLLQDACGVEIPHNHNIQPSEATTYCQELRVDGLKVTPQHSSDATCAACLFWPIRLFGTTGACHTT